MTKHRLTDEVMVACLAFIFRDDAPLRLFGEWHQPLTELPSPTPVGTPCFVCKKPIADGDTGELLERRDSGQLEAFHIDCMALLAFGHQMEVCPCNRFGDCVGEDGRPDFSKAAKLVAERLRTRVGNQAVWTGLRLGRRERSEPS